MQKDKAEKFYLTKRKLQMRKTAKITDYFPGNRDCMRKKQSPPQKDGGDFKKEKYKKDFLLLKPISQINRCVFPFGPASAPEHHFQYDRPKASPAEYDILCARPNPPSARGLGFFSGSGSPRDRIRIMSSNSAMSIWRLRANYLSGFSTTVFTSINISCLHFGQ